MADLEFELAVGRKLALQQMEEFVRDSQKLLDTLVVKPNVKKSGGSGGGSGKSPADEADAEVKRHQAAEKRRAEMLKDAYNQLKIIETNMGRELVNERKRIMEELRNLANDKSLDPNQFRRNISLATAGYRSDLTTDAASARNDMSVRNAELNDAQSRANRLYEIQQNGLYRIEQINLNHGGKLTAQRQQLEARINSIIQNAGNQRTSDISRQVTAEIAQFNRLANTTAGGSQGKNLQYIFQAQQAVEDFSYAGLRGASNNIAMMASQLGGSAGLIALLGITAVQFSNIIAPAIGFGDALKSDKQLIDAINGSLGDMLKIETGNWWADGVDAIDMSADSLKKYQREVSNSQRELDAYIQGQQRAKTVIGDLKSIQNARLTSNVALMGGGDDPEAMRLAVQLAQDQEETVKRIAAEVQSLVPHWKGNLDTVEGVRKALESVESTNRELAVSEQKKRDQLDKQLNTLLDIERVNNRIAASRESIGLREGERFQAIPDSENTPAKRQIRELSRDQRYWEEMANKYSSQGAFFPAGAAASKATELANTIQKLKDAQDAIKDAQREQLDQARDLLREQKELNREKEQQVKHEQSILKEIQNEQRQYNVSNAGSDTDTRQGMTNNMLSKMKARDTALANLSPNDDWKSLMQSQIDQYYDMLQARSDRYFAQERQQQLMNNAKMTADVDPKESRKYLEELQQHQRQQAMNARTPQEAQYWYQQSLKTQKMIEESFAKQKQQQQEKINGIRDEIKSVEQLENRVEQLADQIRNTPKLDLSNQYVLQFLDSVDQKVQDIVRRLQGGAAGGGGGNGGGMMGGTGGNPFDSSGGGNPFGGMDWSDSKWGSVFSPADNGMPVGSNWGGPAGGWNNWGGWGGDSRPNGGAVGGGPAGGWGAAFGEAYSTPSGMNAALQNLPSPYSNYGGQSVTNNTNFSIGNMPVNISGSYDMDRIASSARHAAANNLLRRGA